MARSPKFSVYQDTAGQWRWHLAGANGLVVCQGESHPTKAKALRAAEGVKRLADEACIEVAEPEVAKPSGKPMAKRAPRPSGRPPAKSARR